ncbi:hypothetical protein Amsp01_004860 [Amycolatopsis sp. NBRC 101858]|nr:hypothetical protein Amsp01_004860 [Amycolatopsis sp. NBRC 101858]
MRLDQVPHDGEAESAAAGLAVAGLLGPPEPVEDVRQVTGGDAGAGVRDGDHHLVHSGRHVDRHAAAGRRVPDCVGHQVGDDLAQAHRIGLEPRFAVGRHGERDAGRGGPVGVRGGDVAGQLGRVDRLRVQPQPAGVGRGEVLQVLDDVLQQHGFLEQRRRERPVERQVAVLGGFQPAADDVERVAQLVGDVADHRLALLLDAFAPGGEVVEGGREVADLVAGLHRRRPVLLRRFGQRAQWPGQPACDEHRDRGRQHQHTPGHREDPRQVLLGQRERRQLRPARAEGEEQRGRRDERRELLAAGRVEAALVRLRVGAGEHFEVEVQFHRVRALVLQAAVHGFVEAVERGLLGRGRRRQLVDPALGREVADAERVGPGELRPPARRLPHLAVDAQ